MQTPAYSGFQQGAHTNPGNELAVEDQHAGGYLFGVLPARVIVGGQQTAAEDPERVPREDGSLSRLRHAKDEGWRLEKKAPRALLREVDGSRKKRDAGGMNGRSNGRFNYTIGLKVFLRGDRNIVGAFSRPAGPTDTSSFDSLLMPANEVTALFSALETRDSPASSPGSSSPSILRGRRATVPITEGDRWGSQQCMVMIRHRERRRAITLLKSRKKRHPAGLGYDGRRRGLLAFEDQPGAEPRRITPRWKELARRESGRRKA
ncbi:hypothetical protein KM043_004507 [Ampulex compressa]|nr:hypothetical protein KM043_004507 [Ampulex compressa]